MVLKGARRFGLGLARGRVRRALLLVGLVFAALPAGSALADTTIGQTGGEPTDRCAGPVERADTNYVVPPGGGVITSFSFQSSSRNAGQQLVFLVLRPAGGSKYTVVGKSDVVTLAGTGVETFPLNPNPGPFAVQAGDILGLWNPSVVNGCIRAANGGGLVTSASLSVPEPNIGQTLSLPVVSADSDLNESANLATASQSVGDVGGFDGACHVQLVQGDTTYVVPGGGVITSFSYQSRPQNAGQQLDFLVLRPALNGDYVVTGRTGLVTLKGTPSGTTVERFPANIPVRPGDILGLWRTDGLWGCARPVPGTGGAILSDFGVSDPSLNERLSFDSPSDVDDSNESATFVPTGVGGPPPSPHVCSGSLSAPGVLKGVYPQGVVVKGFCAVNEGKAHVTGTLTVSQGSVLEAAFGMHQSSLTVAGNVVLDRRAVAVLGCKVNSNGTGQACLDDQSKHPTLTSRERISGSIISHKALGLIVHNSAIGQNIKDIGGGGGPTCVVPKSGIFAAFKSPVFSDLEDSTVGGDVRLNGLRTCWMGLARNKVQSYVTININKTADPDAIEVLANHIGKSLSCSGNRHPGPQPKGALPIWDSADATESGLYPRVSEPNTVGGSRSGQCVKASPIKLGGPPAAKHF